jgi:hypothetical protein
VSTGNFCAFSEKFKAVDFSGRPIRYRHLLGEDFALSLKLRDSPRTIVALGLCYTRLVTGDIVLPQMHGGVPSSSHICVIKNE